MDPNIFTAWDEDVLCGTTRFTTFTFKYEGWDTLMPLPR